MSAALMEDGCVCSDVFYSLSASSIRHGGVRAPVELHRCEWSEQKLVDSARFIFNSCITSNSCQPEMCTEDAEYCNVTGLLGSERCESKKRRIYLEN